MDLHKELDVDYAATSPNLLAAYVRVVRGERIATQARATSQAFYVIRGRGVTRSGEHGEIRWKQGDLFVLPSTGREVEHAAEEDTAMYWVSDEPLMRYLGVAPCEKKFEPTLFTWERMLQHVRFVG